MHGIAGCATRITPDRFSGIGPWAGNQLSSNMADLDR
jgi:hypothetical protein